MNDLEPRSRIPGHASDVPRLVLEAFGFDPAICSVGVLGQGHIHPTFEVRCRAIHAVIQRVNRTVFREPRLLERNAARIEKYLAQYPSSIGVPDPIRTVTGDRWMTDARGETWRAFRFIDDASPCPACPTEEQAFEAGRAFGDFLARVANMPPTVLEVPIERFHNPTERLRNLEAACRADRIGRLGSVSDVCRALIDRRTFCTELTWMTPRRVTHNDTKIDNAMLARDTGKAHSVLDLDTVMPGWAAYDVGDCVRSAISGWATVEGANPRRAVMLFESVSVGFLVGGRDTLTAEEVAAFPKGAVAMTVELAARFLSDHLRGDEYFRTSYPAENADRARTQMLVLQAIEHALPAFVEVADRLASSIAGR